MPYRSNIKVDRYPAKEYNSVFRGRQMTKAIKHIYGIFFICAIFLLSCGTVEAGDKDYIKNIEEIDAEIDIDHQQFPAAAYLCVTLKNNGDRKVSNLAFKIEYYDENDYPIRKAVIKNALNRSLLPGETQKYRIRLKGDIVNIANEQYPYERSNEVEKFDTNIIDIKLAKK